MACENCTKIRLFWVKMNISFLFLHSVHHEDLVLLHSNPFDLLLLMPYLISRHWRLMFKAIINLLALQAPSATLSDTHLSGQLFLGVGKYCYPMAQ